MKSSSGRSAHPITPVQIYLLILLLIFVSEFCVMLVLPVLLPSDRPDWLEGLVDACLLTVILLPMLWIAVIRPLRRLAAARTRLLEQFLVVQESERRRIAQDLHDEIGHSLTSLLIQLRLLETASDPSARHRRVEELRGIVAHALHEVRGLARRLRPAALEHLGLVAAVERHAEEIGRLHGIEIRVDAPNPADLQAVPETIAVAAYRIVQEALTNVVRHAGARRARVAIEREHGALAITIEDDGQGFEELGTESVDDGRLGLAGMAERVALLDGTFAIDSRPGAGTRVFAWIPDCLGTTS